MEKPEEMPVFCKCEDFKRELISFRNTMMGKDFRLIYNGHMEHLENELFRPINSEMEYNENLRFIGLLLSKFNIPEGRYSIYLNSAKRAYQGAPVSLCVKPEKFSRLRQNAIFAVSCAELARVEIEEPYLSPHFNRETDYREQAYFLRALVDKTIHEIKKYGTIQEIAEGDDILMMHRQLRHCL